MKNILIVIIAVIAISCGAQKSIQKTYVGKPVTAMETEFGKPKSVLKNENSEIYIFEKIKDLKSTEISQHKITLDPMVTPEVKKTEICTVTVVDGIIKKVVLDEEYERKTDSQNGN